MTDRRLGAAMFAAVLTSALLVPLAAGAIRTLFGPASFAPLFAGSLLATAFFGVTSIVALLTWNRERFKGAVMFTYAVKVVALALAAYLIPRPAFDAAAFATGAAVSGISYLLIQVAGLTQIEEIKTSDRV